MRMLSCNYNEIAQLKAETIQLDSIKQFPIRNK
uniref:Uncharacterized protein n=1 Tax=Rhizophora mucronata TaxID=61149 RepID=A0A2P2IST8_RHIMU